MKHIAFIGNPNTGKSTWINILSNSSLKTGNLSGITVDEKKVLMNDKGETYCLIDLPGVYSLRDEGEGKIVSEYLKTHTIDLIINVVDSTNLQRNMMLTLMLKRLNIPMVVLFNFCDESKNINFSKLSEVLNLNVLNVSIKNKNDKYKILDYIGNEKHYNLKEFCNSTYDLSKELNSLLPYLLDNNERYAFSDKIDKVLLHSYFGFPCMFIILIICFLFIFKGSIPLTSFINYLFHDVLFVYLRYLLRDTPVFLTDFMIHGIFSGLAGVLSFLPLMAYLYFVLAILEECGYMSRIVFLLDRFMSIFHLSGKAFLSLLFGLGCSVPAIYSTRTMKDKKSRRLLALVIPFMSCSAKLPVYILMIQVFFSEYSLFVLFIIYSFSIFITFLLSFILSKFSYFKNNEMFVMEMNVYRIPDIKIILKKVIFEIKEYFHKTIYVVLWVMVLLWAFSYFPDGNINTSYMSKFSNKIMFIFEPIGLNNEKIIASLPGALIAKESVVGYLYQLNEQREDDISIHPLEDLKNLTNEFILCIRNSLTFIFTSDEIVYENNFKYQIKNLFPDDLGKLRAFSFMIYILLSIPCIMTLRAIYLEFGFLQLLITLIFMLMIPYVTCFLIFNIIKFLIYI